MREAASANQAVARMGVEAGLSLREHMMLSRTAYIVAALEHTQGNVVQAARLIGLHRNTLSRLIAMYSVNVNELRKKPSAYAAAAGQGGSRVA